MKKFKINKDKIRRYLYYHIIVAILMTILIVLVVLYVRRSYDFFWSILIFALSWQFLLFLLPLSFLYSNYINYNKGMTLYIRKDEFTLKKGEKIITFSTDEIHKIKIFKSFNNFYNRSVRVALESNYYFTRIFLNNKMEIIITHLLCERIDKFLPKDKITTEPIFYQFIKKTENYWELKVPESFEK